MSGFFRTIFGGSSQNTQSSSTPTDLTPAPFKALQKPFANVLQGLLSGGAGSPLAGIPDYIGQTTAPVTGPEQALLTSLQGLVGGVGSNLLADTAAGKYTDPSTNPFLKAYIEAAQRPTLEGLANTLSRTLPGRFTAAGQFVQPQGSSAFDTAAALASQSAGNVLKDIASNIGFGAYEAERGRQNQAIQLGQDEVKTIISNLQAQALPRLIQQYGLDVGLQEFNTRLNALMQILGIAGGVTRATPAQVSQATGEGTSQTGILPTLLSPFRFTGSLGNV